jgi:membrane-bound metal-dependent hydrolase YbcI (DUF457 family)
MMSIFNNLQTDGLSPRVSALRRMALSARTGFEKHGKYCHDDGSMPSPVGHAIAGAAAAFAVSSVLHPRTLTVPIILASAGLAISPDLDILFGSHRTYTHSIGGVAAVGVACWLALWRRLPHALAPALALTAAYLSHLLLDWLSKDTAPPSGLTALWPFSSTFYQSPWTMFGEISRRYWLPHEFVVSNILAAIWECAVLLPFLMLAWVWWSRRTLAR